MSTDTPDDRWLNIEQACTEANVSRRTIYNWLTAGRLVSKRTAGGGQRILASSLFRLPPVAPAKDA